ncbi:hypothetical protein [Pedobacter antarcticus]|uniref:hypothetical protein n=1 Tax=Pedobacter antarcticus TaxID=34086 RepID=UPI00292CFBEE|nr:hypothetical protein [Pedobacter antarcticus]
MNNNTIFTIEARNNVFLESMAKSMQLDNDTIYDTIGEMFDELQTELKEVKINYSDLKNCLTPQKKKREIAFIFDSMLCESMMYGLEIITQLLQIFDKKSTNSVLVGDYIGKYESQHILRKAFFDHLVTDKFVNYVSSEQFYIVYINNLSEANFEAIKASMADYIPYVGYFDMTFSSPLKAYIASLLIRFFIKDRNTIITGDEDTGYHNPHFYPFEDYGYKSKSIKSICYDIFLSYKIERANIKGGEEDLRFSLNAISKSPLDLSDFRLVIEDPKLQYLYTIKKDNIERAGLLNLTLEEFQKEIKKKIESNYIFNLCFIREHHTIKFNIMLEFKSKEIGDLMKFLVSLEYIAVQKVLRLITMF